jgi:hypothetical protein
MLTSEDREVLSLATQEAFTHFAQSLVLYLGVNSPEELRGFGINSARELVDLMSKVSSISQHDAKPRTQWFGSSPPTPSR